jgi:hypothetical protein
MAPVYGLVCRYRSECLAAGLLAGATLLGLGRVVGNDFVNFDDPAYVTQNLDVQAGLSPESVWWALGETGKSHFWHPLTWLSLQLDCSLFGPRPWGLHLTNLLLHTANAVLLFALLRWMTGAVWRSATVAALFALHPLHVESVAWVSERKDVLSGLFWMLCTLAYLSYLQQPGRGRYVRLLVVYGLGLLAKPMLVTLPCTLLLLDWWPLGRLGLARPADVPADRPSVPLSRLVLEKVPLFVLAAASSALSTFFMTRKGVLKPLDLYDRLANIVVSYALYLRKMVWPTDLAPFYPFPEGQRPLPQVLVAALVLLALTAFCLVQARRRPYLLVGWLWYLGTLVPVIGLLQIGSHALADRYTYVPLIGIFLAVVWYAADVVPARWHRPVLVPAAVLVLAACAAAGWFQACVWRDSITLWRHALATNDNNFLAQYDLAMALEEAGEVKEALDHFEAARRVLPADPTAYSNLGLAYRRHRQLREALHCFRAAARLAPQEDRYHFLLASVLTELGDTEAARREEAEGERLYQPRR